MPEDIRLVPTPVNPVEIKGAIAFSANHARIWAEGTDEEVQALGGEHSAKVWAQDESGRAYTDEKIAEARVEITEQINNSSLNALNTAKDYTDSVAATKQDTIQDLSDIRSGAALGATSLQSSDVINTVDSTATNKPLSANMGKELNDKIDNIGARGRFLALWNCATGLAETQPVASPYSYKSGDYFIVGTVATSGNTNYKPSGSSYTANVPSTAVETNVVDSGDCYYYDGTYWNLQINTQKEITFQNVAGDPYDNTNLASALNAKQDTISDLSTIRSGATAGATAVQPSDLATVATSGSYNDLSNTPTIPTVNNATITLTQGGTTKGTFTLNQSSNATIDLDAGGGSSSVAWGDITGTLSNQTDLQSALNTKLQNTATVDSSLTILGSPSSQINTINIGKGSSVTSYSSVAIGRSAQGGENTISIGYEAGRDGRGISSVAIGTSSTAAATESMAIGANASIYANATRGIAIGYNAHATGGAYAIQLGYGYNTTANTFSVGLSNSNNYRLLESDGTIPSARLPIATTSAVGGVKVDGTTITISNGVISAAGGSSAPTLTWYKNNTGTTVTISDTSSANLVKVYKNGILLEPTEDYSISGTTLTLVTALIATDKITVEVF